MDSFLGVFCAKVAAFPEILAFLISSPIPYCLALQHTQPILWSVSCEIQYLRSPCVDHSISPRPSFTFPRRNFLVIIVRYTHNIDRTFLHIFQSKHPISGCALFHVPWSIVSHSFNNISKSFSLIRHLFAFVKFLIEYMIEVIRVAFLRTETLNTNVTLPGWWKKISRQLRFTSRK